MQTDREVFKKLFTSIGDLLVDIKAEILEQRAIIQAIVRALGNLKTSIDKGLKK